MASTTDPPDVGKANDEIFARYVAARDRGDAGGMKREWGALISWEYDRIITMVRSAGYAILSEHELEEAASEAFERLLEHFVWTFEGSSIGEWVKSVRTLAWVSCKEVQRKAAKRREKEASLYTGRPGDGEDSVEPWAHESFRKHRQDTAVEEDEGHREELVAMGRTFLDWALPQLAERRRIIVELTLAGASTEEKSAALGGVSRDVVYQTWKRAQKDLFKLKEQYPS